MKDEITTITVKKSTKHAFDKLGNLSTTHDEVLNALIKFWKKYKGVADHWI